MKKLSMFIVFAAVMGISLFAQKQQSGMSKEEKAKLKSELKNYMNNLEGYKAHKEDFQMTLDSNEAQIKRLKDELAYNEIQQTELANKATAYESEVKKLQAEAEELKNWNDSAFQASGSIDATHENKGSVYKVQLGLYKNFNITKYFEQPRFIGYETVNGINRYVISYFEDEQTAMNFLKDIRKLGVKDAFVAKYVDGKRVYDWAGSTVKTSEELKKTLEGN